MVDAEFAKHQLDIMTREWYMHPNGQLPAYEWALYCLNMLEMALELARENPVYEDMATKFFEHFIYIADAMNYIGDDATQLWDDDDGFFYDVLHLPHGERVRMKIRSMVGLIPLFAVMTLDPELLERVPNFKQRVEWFAAAAPLGIH